MDVNQVQALTGGRGAVDQDPDRPSGSRTISRPGLATTNREMLPTPGRLPVTPCLRRYGRARGMARDTKTIGSARPALPADRGPAGQQRRRHPDRGDRAPDCAPDSERHRRCPRPTAPPLTKDYTASLAPPPRTLREPSCARRSLRVGRSTGRPAVQLARPAWQGEPRPFRESPAIADYETVAFYTDFGSQLTVNDTSFEYAPEPHVFLGRTRT